MVKLRDLNSDRSTIGLSSVSSQTIREAYRHHRHDGQNDNLIGGEPVQLFTPVQHHLQATDTDDQQRQTDAVDPPLFGFWFPGCAGSAGSSAPPPRQWAR